MTREEIFAALAEPFDPDEVKFKPAVVSGNRAMALGYVDARVVMDRLDDVLGPGNWQTHYRELQDGVVCVLRVRVEGEWVEHEDVGSFSEQPDDGDKLKAAFSDSLKRVAVHLGIGRYLYRLPRQWADYDPQKRQFVSPPRLPTWALPRRKPEAPKPVAQSAAKQPEPAGEPPDSDPMTIGDKIGQLRQVLRQTDVDEVRFCAFLKIAKLDDLPAERYVEALRVAQAPSADLKHIAHEQAENLTALLRKHGIDYRLLFKNYGIGRMGELPADKYQHAQAWIVHEAAKDKQPAKGNGAVKAAK
jgi:hypothetical protein